MRRATGVRAVALFPPLTVAAFLLPIVAGLAGTLLPAFGYLPAIGGQVLTIAPWQALFAHPGMMTSIATTIITGLAATIVSLVLAVSLCAVVHGRHWAKRLGSLLAPILATPHAAIALGVAFLVAPAGWLARALSPWLTGWMRPPDFATVGHSTGWPLVVCLVIKETPFLLLMTVAALHQLPARAQLASAQSLGYGRIEAWLKVVLPQVYPQIRLPIFAVLAFSLSVVDVALIVGPSNPPTLAVLALRWFNDPDVRYFFNGAAAATLQLLIVVIAIVACVVAESIVRPWVRSWIERGVREGIATAVARASSALAIMSFIVAICAIVGISLWSFAYEWRFPDALPSRWTLANWTHGLPMVALPLATTIVVGVAATVIGLVLVTGCLENEIRSHRPPGRGALWLLYLPLIIPQIAFLFGVQLMLVRIGIDGTLGAVVVAHLVFVLPYMFLALADPWRALDPRYARSAASLGASPLRVLLRIRIPLLLAPILAASAVGFAVSVGQYLPTLFAGSGRVATLTTDAVTLAGGADRRVIGTYALLQALLPLAIYAIAVFVPMLRFSRRRGVRGWD